MGQSPNRKNFSVDKLCLHRVPWERERPRSMRPHAQNLFELPGREDVKLHFAAYKSSRAMQRLLPVVDSVLFEDTIDAAYQQQSTTLISRPVHEPVCLVSWLLCPACLR